METQKSLQEAIAGIFKEREVKTYFSPAEIEKAAEAMTKIIDEVAGERKLKEITFHDDEKMFIDLNDHSMHLGLGILKKMVNTWFEIMTGGGTVYMPPEIIKERVLASLRSDAAHEAGHRVIDRNPVKDFGISQQEWGQLGISSLANCLMDCRNDGRIMLHHPDLKSDMEAGLEFGFGPGGRLDWTSGLEKFRLENGHDVLFREFEMEAMRFWTYGQIHAETDPRVRELLEKHQEDILLMTNDKSCVPSKNPQELEVKAKAKKVYKKIAEINAGDYQKVLVARDKDNQAVHQAVSIVGLFQNGQKLHEKLKKFLEEKLPEMDAELRAELEEKLAKQREEKVKFEAEHVSPEAIAKTQGEKAKKEVGMEVEVPAGKPAQAGAVAKEPSLLEQLGPAVMVEKLSDPLREYLKKLFEEMQELMKDEIQQQQLEQMLQELLENPEKFLKEIEDAINEQLRPHTVPSTVPTHQEMEEAPPPEPEPEKKLPPGSGVELMEDTVKPTPRELEETERWLENNIDVKERIQAWRDAIYSVIKGARKKTDRPQPMLSGPDLVIDEIKKKMGMETGGKIFIDTRMEKREKITLSVLWRTTGLPSSEALKLILFLVKIFSDEEIKKYLDLEILVSQDIPGLEHTEGKSPVPVVVSFGDDPVVDYEKILANLMALQKGSMGAGTFPIVQDATALKTQRERLLHQNPGARRKLAIDLWDEMAIQRGVKDPNQAVREEIAKTQEALGGKAFCFVLKSSGASKNSPAKAYGENNFLAERSVERLIQYLDVVVRTMIKYPDTYALHVKEQIERELGISLE